MYSIPHIIDQSIILLVKLDHNSQYNKQITYTYTIIVFDMHALGIIKINYTPFHDVVSDFRDY